MSHTPDAPLLGPLERAAEILGGWGALAKTLGVTPNAVFKWRQTHRPLKGKHALMIEKATEGMVTAHELRPDVFPARNGHAP